MALKQAEELYESNKQLPENTNRRINPAHRPYFPGSLNAVCKQLLELSYSDMRRLAETIEARNSPDRSTADRLVAAAQQILSEDAPAPVPHDGRGPG